MEIPKFLEKKLKKDKKLNGVVHSAIDATSHIINKAHPEFFPEYTDHGPQHNTDVLASAVDLMTLEAREIFSPADAAALILAVLLHDCGMHITPDGFKSLLESDYRGVEGLDDKTWKELWNAFMMEARRYDERTLVELFGAKVSIEEPDLENMLNLTNQDKMLIGDFLRRHHPRLAHEIAINGFPGVEGNINLFNDHELDPRSVWGFIARSHGEDLRDIMDKFSKKFDRYEFQSIHACYLMVLLRIADYMQIQGERAPKKVFEIKRLSSNFSEGEWKVHQSVRNITKAGEDPEAIKIDARPDDVETFLKVKNWTDGIQSELDKSWAVLGEVYGRQSSDNPKQNLKDLQLSLRRVKTNFDDIENFGKDVDYVPRKIAFDTNNPDLLNLLVGPLYDERPEIGIRELMQNAVDAVRERTEIEGKRPTELINGKDDDVSICIDGNKETGITVTITDRGIGMNLDVIENYFLKAGSSFRNSSAWKKNFQNDDGNSKIERSGRFGIGALAAFLIGSKARIRTRYYSEIKGNEFDASLSKTALTVTPCDCPIGTEICIEVDTNSNNPFGYVVNTDPDNFADFYVYDFPKVCRYVNEVKLESQYILDFGNFKHFGVNVSTKKYDNVFYSANGENTSNGSDHDYLDNDPRLYCNGIFISDSFGSELWDNLNHNGFFECDDEGIGITEDCQIPTPSIFVTDKLGNLPLNLKRDGLTQSDSDLAQSIAHQMVDELIAQSIAFAPDILLNNIDKDHLDLFTGPNFVNSPNLFGLIDSQDGRSCWSWVRDGWLPSIYELFPVDVKSTLLLFTKNTNLQQHVATDDRFLNTAIGFQILPFSKHNFKHLIEEFSHHISVDSATAFHYKTPFEVSISNEILDMLFDEILKVEPEHYSRFHDELLVRLFLEKYADIQKFNGNSIVSTPLFQHPGSNYLKEFFSNNNIHNNHISYILLNNNELATSNSNYYFTKRWKELCEDSAIPARFEDRKTVFPKAFDLLGDRIEYYRQQI